MAEPTYGDSLISAQGADNITKDFDLFNKYNDLLNSGYSKEVAMGMLRRGDADPDMKISKMHTEAGKFGTEVKTDMDLDFNASLANIQAGGDSLSTQTFMDKWSDKVDSLPTTERSKYATQRGKLQDEEIKIIKSKLNKADKDAAFMAESFDNMSAISGSGGYDEKMLINIFFPMEDLVNQAMDTMTAGADETYKAAQDPITERFGEQHQLAKHDLKDAPVLREFNKLQEINLKYLQDMEILAEDPSVLGDSDRVKTMLRGNKKEFLKGLKRISKLLPVERKIKTDWMPSVPGSDLPSMPLIHEAKQSQEEAQNEWYVEMVNQYEQALNTLNLKFKQNAIKYQQGVIPEETDPYAKYITN